VFYGVTHQRGGFVYVDFCIRRERETRRFFTLTPKRAATSLVDFPSAISLENLALARVSGSAGCALEL